MKIRVKKKIEGFKLFLSILFSVVFLLLILFIVESVIIRLTGIPNADIDYLLTLLIILPIFSLVHFLDFYFDFIPEIRCKLCQTHYDEEDERLNLIIPTENHKEKLGYFYSPDYPFVCADCINDICCQVEDKEKLSKNEKKEKK